MNQPVDDSDDTQEHFVRAARTSQEAISSAIRIWGETTQSMFGLTSAPGAAAPALEHLLERWFDAAEDMLRAQREFSEGLLASANPLWKRWPEPPSRHLKQWRNPRRTYPSRFDRQRASPRGSEPRHMTAASAAPGNVGR